MKTRRLLCALIALALCLSLPAALAVENVPLGDSEGFWIDLPSGWRTMNENLENSNILGFTPGAMYDYDRADGAARAFALHFTGFSSPITLDQVARYLGAEGIAPDKMELNGETVLAANVAFLGVYGIAFLDQDATGYYIIGVLPCDDGGLEDQPAYVQAFFAAIRFLKPGETPSKTQPPAVENVSAAVEAVSASVRETVTDVTESVKSAADAAPVAGRIAELENALEEAKRHAADMEERVDQLLQQLTEADNAVAEAYQNIHAIQEQLDEARAKSVCKNCGYQFPEDSEFLFCPLCGTAR